MAPHEPPELPPVKPPFRLTGYNRVLLGLAYAFALVLFFMSPDKSPERIGYTVGMMIGWTLFPAILAYLVYWISGRRNAASSIVFAVLLALGVLGHIGTLGKKAVERIEADKSMTTLRDQRDQAKREFAESGDVEAWGESFDALIADTAGPLAALANSTSGKEKQFYGIMAAFMQDSKGVLDRWRVAFDRARADRVLDFARLTTEEEYDYQIGAVETYYAESLLYREYFAQSMPDLRARLGAMGPGDPMGKIALAEAEAKHEQQAPVFEPLMQAHLDYADAMLGLLQLLSYNHAEWVWGDEQIRCYEDLPIAEFNVFVEQLGHAENRSNRLSQELIERS